MIRLGREIRFAAVPAVDGPISNSWSGWPATAELAPHWALQCVVAGEVDSQTGYVCNIKDLDRLMRQMVTDVVVPGLAKKPPASDLLAEIFSQCVRVWPGPPQIVQVTLGVSPYLRLSIRSENECMFQLTQQFEFSAAHRLACPDLSEQENRSLFGKCANPNGHGHNYILEISWRADNSDGVPSRFELPQLEATVKRLVIDQLDHKHLNLDVDYFRYVNPSVENIAKAIWGWLDGQFGELKLVNVRVYETPKTWADYCDGQ